MDAKKAEVVRLGLMKDVLLGIVVATFAFSCGSSGGENASVISQQAASGAGSFIRNRAPLASSSFSALPLGTVMPDGWLLAQLSAQRDGATGQAEAMYAELSQQSPWHGGPPDTTGQYWQERAPYYVKGLVPLAYLLDDAGLKEKAQSWLDFVLNSQDQNGALGPAGQDWWGLTPMLYALRDFFEATGDPRVIPALNKYLIYELKGLDQTPLTSWAKSRYGDVIDMAFWVYNQTGDPQLLVLTDKLAAQGFDWASLFANNGFTSSGDFQTRHNVNVTQALRTPALLSLQHPSATLSKNYVLARQTLMSQHGQLTGTAAGTEALSGSSSTVGVELCATVEHMQSTEIAQLISGDPSLGDELEQVAFNGLAGATTADFKHHSYFSLPNQHQAVYGNHGFEQDYSNALMPSPTSGYPCCRFNMHMGWPYFTKHLWAATSDGGLAAMAYAPSHLTTAVADGQSVTLKAVTNYPFEEKITITVETAQEVTFPLLLRIPSWASGASIVAASKAETNVQAGTYHRVERAWKNNDTVVLNLPMGMATSRWVNHAVSISRGPLAFAIDLGEQLNPQTPTNVGEGFSQPGGYTESLVTPTKPYNMALILDAEKPQAGLSVVNRPMPSGSPFDRSTVPIYLTGQARRVTWPLSGVLTAEPPLPGVGLSAAESVALIPFGSSRIRMSYLPVAIPESSRIEAESGTRSGSATFASNIPGYSGSGFVSLPGGQNASVTVNLAAAQAGPQVLVMRYGASAGGGSGQSWTLNGTGLTAPTLSQTSGSSAWADAPPVIANLAAGTNTLQITGGSTTTSVDAVGLFPLTAAVYESEAGVLTGGAQVSTEHPRFGGAGYVDFHSTPGAAVTATVYAAKPGLHDLRLRYAAGDGAPVTSLSVSINGTAATVTPLPSTGSWTLWQDSSAIRVMLQAGANSIRIQCGMAPYLNMDAITIVADDAP